MIPSLEGCPLASAKRSGGAGTGRVGQFVSVTMQYQKICLTPLIEFMIRIVF